MLTQPLFRILALAAVFALAGCAMPEVFKLSKDDFPKASPRNPVIRILGMWEPAEGMLQGKSTRGFSSQLLFFTQNSDLAAQADGDVIVYVFDDQGTAEQQAIPYDEYRIEPDAWNAHMNKGPLGNTYSVFIPYRRPGKHEAKCSLRVRFMPKGGPPVYSNMMNVVLPGEKKARADAHSDDRDDTTTEAILEVDPDGEAFNSLRNNISKHVPPRARGKATTIPTPQEAQEQLHAQQRIKATELNAKERRRIMREAVAQLESEKASRRVAQAGYEEPESEIVADESEIVTEEDNSTAQNSSRQPMQQLDDGDDDSDDTAADDEPAPEVLPRAKPSQTHILDDED